MSCHRMHLPGDVHLVTNRCLQGRLLMLPNEDINFIIGYWFARALEKFGQGIEVFAFVFLGNHWLCAAAHKKCYPPRSVMWFKMCRG